jgi:hypothetical protein
MKPALQSGAVLIVAAVLAIGAQKESPKKGPAMSAQRPASGQATVFPKTPPKQGPGRVPNPAHQFERLLSMTPDQRERVIEKLPPQQQERLRARLDQFDKLPPAQKAWRLELANRYFALPPERQQAFTENVRAFNKLPGPRKRVLSEELKSLWAMPEADRQAKLSSEAYQSRFSPEEMQILNTISAANILNQ